jgi:hypothetical protein
MGYFKMQYGSGGGEKYYFSPSLNSLNFYN